MRIDTIPLNGLSSHESLSSKPFDDLKDLVFELAHNEDTPPLQVLTWVKIALSQAQIDFENGNAEKIVERNITGLRAQILLAMKCLFEQGVAMDEVSRVLEGHMGVVLKSELSRRISRSSLPKKRKSGRNRRVA